MNGSSCLSSRVREGSVLPSPRRICSRCLPIVTGRFRKPESRRDAVSPYPCSCRRPGSIHMRMKALAERRQVAAANFFMQVRHSGRHGRNEIVAARYRTEKHDASTRCKRGPLPAQTVQCAGNQIKAIRGAVYCVFASRWKSGSGATPLHFRPRCGRNYKRRQHATRPGASRCVSGHDACCLPREPQSVRLAHFTVHCSDSVCAFRCLAWRLLQRPRAMPPRTQKLARATTAFIDRSALRNGSRRPDQPTF